MSSKIYINEKCRRKYAILSKEQYKSRFHHFVVNAGGQHAELGQSITWITSDDFSPRTSESGDKSNKMSNAALTNVTPKNGSIKRRGKRSVPQKEHYTRSKKQKLESPCSPSAESVPTTATVLSSVTLSSRGMDSFNKQTSVGVCHAINRVTMNLDGLPLVITITEPNDNISSLDDPEVETSMPVLVEATKCIEQLNIN